MLIQNASLLIYYYVSQNAHGYGSEFSDCNSEVELSRKQKKYEKDTLLKKPNL